MSDEHTFEPIGDILDRYKARQDRERFHTHHPGEPEHPNDRLARLVKILGSDTSPDTIMLIDVEWLVDQVLWLRSELEHIAESEPVLRRRIQTRLDKPS